MISIKHFLDISALETSTLREILDAAAAYKREEMPHGSARPLDGKTLALIFEKPSTRTRVSFEVGMKELGGNVVILNNSDSQLGRGESIADTARVLSRYVDAIMIRTDDEKKLHDMAKFASVPVINGLTDQSHPCQIMADLLTFEERLGPIEGQSVTWVGDGNNVAVSWIHAAVKFGFELRLACPASLSPPADCLEWARSEGGRVFLSEDPKEAVRGSSCVVTDTWVSMNHDEDDPRRKTLEPYQVNADLMALAEGEAIFMHCLPAHRGEEVTSEVIDGDQSVIWDEAENRLHAQKGIVTWCLL